MRLSPTLQLRWGYLGPSALAFSNQHPVWTNYLSTADSDQLGIFVDASNAQNATNVYVSVFWAAADETGEILSSSPGASTGWFPDSIRTPDVRGQPYVGYYGDTIQRYQMYAEEFIVTPGRLRSIWLPTAAPYFQIGLSVGSIGATDFVYTCIQLASLGDPQGTS